MSDHISISALRLVASVGVLIEETTRPQPIELDLDLEADLSNAGASDELADTVNYAAVVDAAVETVAGRHFSLLESLATEVGQRVLAVDGRIETVRVTVTKLRPPLAHDVATVSVTCSLAR